LADAFLIEKLLIETNKFYIGKATRKTKNIRIVQISDLHLRSINYRLTRLAKKLNKLKPHLLVLTGDAIDKANNIGLLQEFLQLIDFNVQKASILGNWEYQGKVDLTALNKLYNSQNCKLLINQTLQYTFYNKSVAITGVDDYLCGRPDFNAALENYRESDYHIVLTHCPRYSDHLSMPTGKDVNIDFILAGHTHGGQITLFGYVPYTPRGSGRYVKGWYKDRHPHLYVSKGIGTVSIPLRFGARPELTVFYLST